MASVVNEPAEQVVVIKTEDDEDSEIDAMARKLKEKYKQNATAAAKQKAAPPAINKTNKQEILTEDCVYIESIKGVFAWMKIGGFYIPYIFRIINGKHLKFVSVRMAETQLLSQYINYLHADNMYKCTAIKSYFISDYEAKLLNEINQKHADCGYGKEIFVAGKDFIVTLEDVQEFNTFMDICYKKIVGNITPDNNEKCGFIYINSDSVVPEVVPYCTIDGKKFVPIFYFEGQTKHFMSLAVKIENWNLAYVKFCCNVVQGIKNEFLDSDSCEMLNLDDIKNFYSPETNFIEFWPTFVNIQPDINQLSNRVNTPRAWFRAPPEVVPSENTIPCTLIEVAPPVPHTIPENKNTYQKKRPVNQMINSYTNQPQTQTQPPSAVRIYYVARRNRSIVPQCYNTGSMSQGSSLRNVASHVAPSLLVRSAVHTNTAPVLNNVGPIVIAPPNEIIDLTGLD
ncbi:uncharacterized protein LOC132947917 [Metopolophium dirhodum]|uniref:uncharacterized protein LOC132947917 n=1 Tax=Metopolophium dirhodum TaxID=44670 RepID=UPI0029904A18|nr:uncharacterized protein LOC132947917 [Metopolophium dirhodum]